MIRPQMLSHTRAKGVFMLSCRQSASPKGINPAKSVASRAAGHAGQLLMKQGSARAPRWAGGRNAAPACRVWGRRKRAVMTTGELEAPNSKNWGKPDVLKVKQQGDLREGRSSCVERVCSGRGTAASSRARPESVLPRGRTGASSVLYPGPAFWKQIYFSANWLGVLGAGRLLQPRSLGAAEPTSNAFPSAAPPPPSPACAALPAPCGSALSAGCAAFSTSLI